MREDKSWTTRVKVLSTLQGYGVKRTNMVCVE